MKLPVVDISKSTKEAYKRYLAEANQLSVARVRVAKPSAIYKSLANGLQSIGKLLPGSGNKIDAKCKLDLDIGGIVKANFEFNEKAMQALVVIGILIALSIKLFNFLKKLFEKEEPKEPTEQEQLQQAILQQTSALTAMALAMHAQHNLLHNQQTPKPSEGTPTPSQAGAQPQLPKKSPKPS